MDPAKTNALLASYRQGNFHWHIDGAIDEYPQQATLLTARAVDPAGGDTEFANTYAAYAALTDRERAEIDDLQAVHSFAHAQALANKDATEDQRRSWDRALLEKLLDWSTQPQFRLRHKWRRGDLVIWDNTGMLHRALPFEPSSMRLMHRTTLVGEEPVVTAS